MQQRHRTGAWRLAPAYDVSFSRGPGGEHTLLVAREGRRPGRAQIDQVAAKAGIKPKRAGEIVAQVEAAVAGWDRHAQQVEVPRAMAQQIAEAMDMAKGW